MLNLTKSNIKRLILPFILLISIGFIYEVSMILYVSKNGSVQYPIEQWFIANEIIDFLFPILCVFPFCWVYYFEKKDGYIKYLSTRICMKSYIFNRYKVTCLISGTSIFLIYFFGLLISLYIIKPSTIYESNFINSNFLGNLQAENPLLFGFLLCLLKGFICCLFCSLGILLSLLINNLFVVLTGPFIYVTLENYILGMLSLPQYNIYTTFSFNRLDPSSMSLISLFVPIAIAIILNLILISISSRKDLSNV